MSSEELLVIDTDAGTDDAQAILMALAHPRMRVQALTTVSGNILVDAVALNCLRVLQVANRLDIPVYKGCAEPLLGLDKDGLANNGFHGDDGLGDAPDRNSPDVSHLRAEHAVHALIQLANQHPGQINLVAIGPLTNIAVALRLDPHFGTRLKHCYIMGGNMQGKGNITVSGEFNFACDPEAAYIALNQLKCPITMVTMEMCQECFLEWDWYYDTFISANTDIGRFVKKIDAKVAARFQITWKTDKYWTWDQLLMAVAIDNRVSLETKHVYATVELSGSMTRGQVVVDWNDRLGRERNVYLVTKADNELYMELLLKAMYGRDNK